MFGPIVSPIEEAGPGGNNVTMQLKDDLALVPTWCVDIRPLWGLFGPYKETNVRVLSLWGPLRGTNLCVKAKSIPGTPRIINIPLLK